MFFKHAVRTLLRRRRYVSKPNVAQLRVENFRLVLSFWICVAIISLQAKSSLSTEIVWIRNGRLEMLSVDVDVDGSTPICRFTRNSLAAENHETAEIGRHTVHLMHTTKEHLDALPSSCVMTSAYGWIAMPGDVHTGLIGINFRYHLLRIDRTLFRTTTGGPVYDPELLRLEFEGGFVPGESKSGDAPLTRFPGKGAGYVCLDEGCADLAANFGRYLDRNRKFAERSKVAIALSPLGKLQCRMYVVCEPTTVRDRHWEASDDRQLYVLDYEFGDKPTNPNRGPDELIQHQWNGVWSLRAKCIAGFVEEFDVVPQAAGDYFVTKSGRLFFLDWQAPKSGKEMREIKLRNGQLIQALVIDGDHDNRAFAFTSEFYFEVKDPLQYREFDLGPLSQSDPIPALKRCARTIAGR